MKKLTYLGKNIEVEGDFVNLFGELFRFIN